MQIEEQQLLSMSVFGEANFQSRGIESIAVTYTERKGSECSNEQVKEPHVVIHRRIKALNPYLILVELFKILKIASLRGDLEWLQRVS